MRYTFLLPLLLLSCAQPAPQPPMPEPTSKGESTAQVFQTAEKMPVFEGNLAIYLDTAIRFPAAVLKSGKGGKAITSFIVRKDGRVTDVKTVRSSGDQSLDAEAVRGISGMKSWKPAVAAGVPVDMSYTLPILFDPSAHAQG